MNKKRRHFIIPKPNIDPTVVGDTVDDRMQIAARDAAEAIREKLSKKEKKRRLAQAKNVPQSKEKEKEKEKERRAAINEAIKTRQAEKLKASDAKSYAKMTARDRELIRENQMDARRRFGGFQFVEQWNMAEYDEELERIESEIRKIIGKKDLVITKLNLRKYLKMRKFKKDEALSALYEEYKYYKNLKDKIDQSNINSSYWERWDPGDLPDKTASERMVEHVEMLAGYGGKIPVIGSVISAVNKIYLEYKEYIKETWNALWNIGERTRKTSSAGRIAGMVVGGVVGAATLGLVFVGVNAFISVAGIFVVAPILGVVGSIYGAYSGFKSTETDSIPKKIFRTVAGGILGGVVGAGLGIGISMFLSYLGVGIATVGSAVAGVILGGSLGAGIGLSLFKGFSRKFSTLSDESDYEMEYRDLRRLKKLYGFKEDIILKMYSYLNNKIKLLGEAEGGKSLDTLRINALEEGREASLGKLCVYFITQEEVLRSQLYDISQESILIQKERYELLVAKMDLTLEENVNQATLESIEEKLSENHQRALDLAGKRFELTRERDGILDILQEFRDPSEFYDIEKEKESYIHVYNNMMKINVDTGRRLLPEDKIGKLFIESDTNKGDQSQLPLSQVLSKNIQKPRPINSLGEYPYSFAEEDKSIAKSRRDFKKQIRGTAILYLKAQAALSELQRVSYEDAETELKKAEKILGKIEDKNEKFTELNHELSNQIFTLRKIKQMMEKEGIDPGQIQVLENNIQQLENVQFFMQFSDKSKQYPSESPIRDVIGDKSSSLRKRFELFPAQWDKKRPAYLPKVPPENVVSDDKKPKPKPKTH